MQQMSMDRLLMGLSDEQNEFIDKALEGKNVLVDACIGSGKTTAIQSLCNLIPDNKSVLYLTYNKLLKLDAKSKIKNKNVTVTNYHGLAYNYLVRNRINVAVPETIIEFNRVKPVIKHYDILIIDEYQDIETEMAEMLEYIKSTNEQMQVIAVGDMDQKIYDKTTLDVPTFMDRFLGNYEMVAFTKCFRLSSELASRLGKIWGKSIEGVNKSCVIEHMKPDEIVEYLSKQNPADILCLGQRTGRMADVLNLLEHDYPDRFNKKTVYASIYDNDSLGGKDPSKKSAIFTTYDSSKGLERPICVVFDFSVDYWKNRLSKPLQNSKILRNIFCVAASRGKGHIIFVDTGNDLTDEDLMTGKGFGELERVAISSMFDFKYKEDVEACMKYLEITEIERSDHSTINIKENDELIDLSPCIGIYQEAMFFSRYNIDKALDDYIAMHKEIAYMYNGDIRKSSLEEKILFLVSLETHQKRYVDQVDIPFVDEDTTKRISDRLREVFHPEEAVQVSCYIDFKLPGNNEVVLAAGRCDVVKNETVYELKFVNELKIEHFLQCACYILGLHLHCGIVWNIKDNKMYQVKVLYPYPFLEAVLRAISKRTLDFVGSNQVRG